MRGLCLTMREIWVWGLLMPRNRMLARIDEELMQARESLKFWRDQMLMLSDTEFQVAAKRQVMHREADINRLLETQEMLHGAHRDSNPPTTS